MAADSLVTFGDTRLSYNAEANRKLFTVNDVFGSWSEAQEKHFKDGGVFDSIYVPNGGNAAAAK